MLTPLRIKIYNMYNFARKYEHVLVIMKIMGIIKDRRSVGWSSPIVPALPSLSQRLLELDLQRRDLADEVSDGVGEGFLGAVVRRRLHPQDKLVLQGVGDLVPREEDLRVSQELAGEGRGGPWIK